MSKPKAQYVEIAFLQVGRGALIWVLTHPERLFGKITTSKVVKISADGKCFETLNTLYVPVSDPDAGKRERELREKETEDG